MNKNKMQKSRKKGLNKKKKKKLEGDRDRLFSGKMVKLRHELIEHFWHEYRLAI